MLLCPVVRWVPRAGQRETKRNGKSLDHLQNSELAEDGRKKGRKEGSRGNSLSDGQTQREAPFSPKFPPLPPTSEGPPGVLRRARGPRKRTEGAGLVGLQRRPSGTYGPSSAGTTPRRRSRAPPCCSWARQGAWGCPRRRRPPPRPSRVLEELSDDGERPKGGAPGGDGCLPIPDGCPALSREGELLAFRTPEIQSWGPPVRSSPSLSPPLGFAGLLPH